jgi:hydrogenase expression/formation protein HypE
MVSPYRIDAVLFDFDGTLTEPGSLDFSIIKKQVGCPLDQPVLEFIQSMDDETASRNAMAALDAFETAGAHQSVPRPGAETLIGWLKATGIPTGILTRNSRRAILAALENFDGVGAEDFDVIVSRDDPAAPKPSPEGVFMAARQLGVSPEHILVVGDFHFDMDAGTAAGALTAYIGNTPPGETSINHGDFQVVQLSAIQEIVQMGRPLGAGKLPNPLLEKLLSNFSIADESVILAAGIGEDTAAVDVGDADTLILKSDPITFATDAIGHYAVVVNANDIATAGAVPRWMLTSLLFPIGVTGAEIHRVMDDLLEACGQWGITLCGGHTEITDAVSRSVVIGMMAGTVPRHRLIDKRRMQRGDKILMTKAAGVEGTAIIAREFGERLLANGLTRDDLHRCREFLEHISILPEARIAAGHGGVTAMHDVTEGGVATAVRELAIAGGHDLVIEAGSVPIYPETRQIAAMLGIDPLGLIGSGSLLICCHAETADALATKLDAAGIPVSIIGTVDDRGRGILVSDGEKWPAFSVDEITRLFG